MYIVPVQDLLFSLGELGGDDIEEMLKQALSVTTTFCEDVLPTTLARKTVVDTFQFTDVSLSKVGSFITLKLKHGFVDVGQPFEIRFASTRTDLGSMDPDDSSNYALNAEQGHVTLFSSYEIGTWCQVTYTSGFDVDSNNAFATPTVPSWLKDIAMGYATAYYKELEQLNSFLADKKGSKLHNVEPPEITKTLLNHHVRWYPTAFDPVMSI
ncbi:MAG: hypothetical protein GWN00_01415 [Aliifodinibius sp.]|nr:hypothetical protein [Phycisphaerae bacterium]NIR62339.1 hypothetical protein [candidate division Zixibacteria bacterium]NIT54937.1 hypothetical protein [Fodinibius sp.]NIW43351.1 hypothetical protein [Gammaproteobacteria bacterium]NIU12572.1 hypothetical protein [candidate division Zixibacteria bacterium]